MSEIAFFHEDKPGVAPLNFFQVNEKNEDFLDLSGAHRGVKKIMSQKRKGDKEPKGEERRAKKQLSKSALMHARKQILFKTQVLFWFFSETRLVSEK